MAKNSEYATASTMTQGDSAAAEQPVAADEATLNYEVEAEHARGGLGRVLRAWDRRLNRLVAIKELLAARGDHARRFVREVEITARLQHPSIVPVYEAGRWSNGAPFFAMKFVSGRSLRQLIDEATTLDQRLALLPHVLAVADAIAYAHSQGVIHRDLKPSNVMTGDFGETVVIDWGLAKEEDDSSPTGDPVTDPYRSVAGETIEGTVLGTPSYMPPEQARGLEVDARADVYSLGALIYHVLAGRPPFAGDTPAVILDRVLAGPPEPLERCEPGVPPDLVTIVKKAMDRVPERRYATAQAVADDLRRFQTGQLVGAHHYTRTTLMRRWLWRHRSTVAVAVLLLVVLSISLALSVRRILLERRTAMIERTRADQRTHELILTQARTMLNTDPTATIGWVKEYAKSGAQSAAAARIAVDALSRGVARSVIHTEPRTVAIALSPDAHTLVTGGEGKTVQVWSLPQAKLRAAIDFPQIVFQTAFSFDGSRFAVAGQGGVLAVFTTDQLRRIDLVGHQAAVTVIRFSPDGRTLLTLDAAGEARWWNLEARTSKSIRATLPPPDSSAGFLSDGTPVALIPYGHVLEVLAVDGSRPTRRLVHDGEIDYVTAAVRAPMVAIGGKGSLEAWDLDSGTRLGAVPRLGNLVGLSVSADGHHVAHWYDDRSAAVWTIGEADSRVIRTRERIYSAAFSADGAMVAIGGNGGAVTLWDVAADSTRLLLGHTDVIARSVFAADNSVLISAGDDDHTVRVWPINRTTARVLRGHRDEVLAVSLSPDGSLFATAASDGVRLWNVAGGAPRVFSDGQLTIQETRFSPDGRRLAWARWDGTARWVDLVDGRKGSLPHGIAVERVLWLADGTTLATAASDGWIRLWPTNGGNPTLLGRHDGEVNTLALSPDGQQLLSCGQDGTVRLWNLRSKKMQLIGRHSAAVDRAFFTTDGHGVVSAGYDGAVHYWDLTTGRSSEQHLAGAEWRSLAVSPTGPWVAAGAQNGLIALWNPTRGDGLRHLRGHGGVVRNLAFSPDGNVLASVSFDHTVRLWKIPTGEMAVLRGHEGAVISLAFSRDGKQLVTTSSDMTARVWSLQTVRFAPSSRLDEWLDEVSDVTAMDSQQSGEGYLSGQVSPTLEGEDNP